MCPTAECDHDVTYKMQSSENDVPSEKGVNVEDSSEAEQTVNEENSKMLPENVDADQNSLKYIKAYENLNNLFNNPEKNQGESNNYIDTIVSESLKEKITKKSKGNGEEIEKCGFSGCSRIEEQIKSINDITMGLVENIDKINDKAEDIEEKEEPILMQSIVHPGDDLFLETPTKIKGPENADIEKEDVENGDVEKDDDNDTDETIDETEAHFEGVGTDDEDISNNQDDDLTNPNLNGDKSRTRSQL